MDQQPMTERQAGGDLLALVHEGMQVYDRDGKRVGKVTGMFMGAAADSVENPGVVPQTSAGSEMRGGGDDSLIGDFADVFDPDSQIPGVLRNRLRYNGFIRVDRGGILKSFCYALREHVAGVTGDRVNLNIGSDEMIKA